MQLLPFLQRKKARKRKRYFPMEVKFGSILLLLSGTMIGLTAMNGSFIWKAKDILRSNPMPTVLLR